METIAAGVHQVSGAAVNSFLVDGDEGVVLIDTGLPKRQSSIVDALGSIGRTVDDVVAILLTHSHADHMGGAAALKRSTGAPIFASTVDAPAIRGEAPIPHPPVLDRVPFLKPLYRLLPGPEPAAVDQLVDGGASLPEDFTIIATPGHTPGHVSYLLDRDGGVLFVGDAAVGSKSGAVKRGWMNRATPGFDASLARIADLDFETACFGHSGPLRSGAAEAFRRFAASIAG